MARTRRARQVYADLLERYGRSVAEAFLRAIDNLRSAAEVARLTAAIEAGQIEEALDALHIDPEAFNEVADRLRDAHAESGRATAESMPSRRPDGTALVVRFDGRNPEAEAWLSRQSSDLITRITEEQRQNVRDALARGMREGRNPRQTALDIVGRISRVTGKRVGGTLGLSSPQAEYVARAREQLAAGDPASLREYLSRKRIDRRFNRTVEKAIREERPIPAATRARMITAYENQLLRLRGETIGRVESMTAIQRAKFEAYRQAISSGKVDESAITKVWRSASDLRVRHTHRGLNGESARFREPFRSPSGALLLFPMDSSMGAGAGETVNCRCDCEYRVDFLTNIR